LLVHTARGRIGDVDAQRHDVDPLTTGPFDGRRHQVASKASAPHAWLEPQRVQIHHFGALALGADEADEMIVDAHRELGVSPQSPSPLSRRERHFMEVLRITGTEGVGQRAKPKGGEDAPVRFDESGDRRRTSAASHGSSVQCVRMC
jgi:hypothetical protein